MKNKTILSLLAPGFALMVQGCTGEAEHEYAPLDIDRDQALLHAQAKRAAHQMQELKKASLDGQGRIYWDAVQKTGVSHSSSPEILQPSRIVQDRQCKAYYNYSSLCSKWYYFASATRAEYGWKADDIVQKLSLNQQGQIMICPEAHHSKNDDALCRPASKEIARAIESHNRRPS